MKKLQKNIYLFYIISFLQACIFTTPIWSFFFTSYLNFSFSTALNLIILSWIVSFILEIPSWSWADRYWRKKMFILWILLSVISFSIWTIFTTLIAFIFAGIIQWISIALISGNFEALIHDSLEHKKQTNRYKDIQSNAYTGIFLWRAFSSLTAWFLFTVSPLLPIYATIISYILILVLLIFVKESKQNIASQDNTKQHIKLNCPLKSRVNKKTLCFFYFLNILIKSI